ncbi:DMT family transporter [Aliigemmobacter aestuarii]|uniref:DMT family transporter n=1 Tax=Aliigemmobacter aestuarii TaxID=1445661 RepID=A0A4S3MR07_9RHOB|nr:DMT family transporter [Gemmobacter aestuarii]THD84946.1 DMT family transporter [Gemmobacter aestuarii]
MRLFLVTALAMLAFAGNSVLNRMAVAGGAIDPMAFAVWRVVAGAGMLALLVAFRRARSGGVVWAGWAGRGAGVAGLLVYLFGFSLAYAALDAGTGALILFGAVQVTMFLGALWLREDVPPRRWVGAGLAFGGLVLLLAPGQGAVPVMAAGMMALAGVGWGFYSLAGRRAGDALAATAANFVLAVPVALTALALLPEAAEAVPASARGIVLAVLSGAVTSGMGYALWYAVLPQLGAGRGAVAQLTVPVIAAAGGAALIGEGVGWRFALASALVLGGVAWASLPARQSGLTRR